VLPFANVSGDAAQEFFSDGMTDEIIAALAKIKDLKVVARTSAFQFKGEKKDMRAIGLALNARYLIDGSVRKAGDRVRITAQLVQADNGVGVWTDSYDREIKDVFAVQEDIAQAIAASLRVPLGLQQGDSLVANRTADLESYDDYLKAKAMVRSRGLEVAQAIGVLEKVVARDPSFAPAWAMLAYAYALAPGFLPGRDSMPVAEANRLLQTYLAKADSAARKAIQLDARQPGGYVALAYTHTIRGKWVEAEDLYKQALVRDPNDPDALQEYSNMLGAAGRLKDALRMREQLRMLEPFVPAFNLFTASAMMRNGMNTAAIALLERVPNTDGGAGRNSLLAQAYANEGRFAEAADTLLSTPPQNVLDRKSIEGAARLLRGLPNKPVGPLPKLEGTLSFVYAFTGSFPRTIEYSERNMEIGNAITVNRLWAPLFTPIRKTERFKALMRKAGLVDYWKARGWPDLCRPVGADDFACE
jgi:TolB-like protein/Tfp pilus assembly protein PilF